MTDSGRDEGLDGETGSTGPFAFLRIQGLTLGHIRLDFEGFAGFVVWLRNR